jgi:peptidoglycan DL-endopeptidase LytE
VIEFYLSMEKNKRRWSFLKKKVVSAATIAILSTAFAASASADTYIVQKGDTLSHIAIKYKTSVSELKRINSLSTDRIYINQSLQVSQSSETVQPIVVPPAVTTPVQTPALTVHAPAKTYTVVSGDNLSKIAYKHGISLANLMAWNNISSHLIYPGNVLKVSDPGSSASVNVPTEPAPVPAPTPAPAPAAQIVAPPAPPANTDVYTIKSGDTLSVIALRFKTTVAELKSLNNLRSDLIYVGQTIKVTTNQEANSGIQVVPVANTPAPVSHGGVNALLNEAKALIGIPYLWGGSSVNGFDCSGFIYYVFNKSGVKLTRTSAEGYYSRSYYVNTPLPGDLVFFENTYKKGISHLGIYLGNNEFIHADSSGVRITNLSNSYYKQHFDGFKRLY